MVPTIDIDRGIDGEVVVGFDKGERKVPRKEVGGSLEVQGEEAAGAHGPSEPYAPLPG